MNTNMPFSKALIQLKAGYKVSRENWNDTYLLLVRGEAVTKSIHNRYGNPSLQDKSEIIPVTDTIYMKTADNTLEAWNASQSDLLADDWQVV